MAAVQRCFVAFLCSSDQLNVLQQPSTRGVLDEPVDKVCLTAEGEYKESKPNKLLEQPANVLSYFYI
jgi:hypothetical protein